MEADKQDSEEVQVDMPGVPGAGGRRMKNLLKMPTPSIVAAAGDDYD